MARKWLRRRTMCFEDMIAALNGAEAGDVALLHGCCHNPTGADLSQDEWRAVLELVKRRRLLPFIDMAYQGLGAGLEADTFGLRLFAAELPDRRMTLKAVVVMNSRSFDEKDATKMLQDFVKAKLLPYKYPREVKFIDELPKTGTGKIQKFVLRDRARSLGSSAPAVRSMARSPTCSRQGPGRRTRIWQ